MSELFLHLNRRRQREFDRLVPTHDVDAGTVLMREGQPGDTFMVIVDGQGEVSSNGEILRPLASGDFFGELALLPAISGCDGRRTATVMTTGATRVGVCNRTDFDRLLERFPRIGGQILAQAYALSA